MVSSSADAAVDAALELQESGWEELRREARKLEGDLDVKLSSYARLASRTSASSAPAAASPSERSSWKSMELEIQSLLDKLQDVNDGMSRCAASTASTTSVSQKLARHRDILHEFAQEFRRTRGNLSSMREHADLLSSVRDDITESKATGGMSPRVHLLRERASIHGSITQVLLELDKVALIKILPGLSNLFIESLSLSGQSIIIHQMQNFDVSNLPLSVCYLREI
ncbi:hypothetical protein GUJ93_ZPchr0002g23592 [Zizania palustris]|uniref:Golgi SNAP receptor complex member 1 n=1 Tax=Zizania palustris TaxID=103762 RepID=A0A8J5S1E9_ZIZPA|nr:hypothetical protein GUJ93_ZPchr0002g23592 [Zizania palustris]